MTGTYEGLAAATAAAGVVAVCLAAVAVRQLVGYGLRHSPLG